MGFCPGGVWVMGYCGLMGYGVQFPAHWGSRPKNVWDFRGYGLWQAWIMRVLTVTSNVSKEPAQLTAMSWEDVQWIIVLPNWEQDGTKAQLESGVRAQPQGPTTESRAQSGDRDERWETEKHMRDREKAKQRNRIRDAFVMSRIW